MGNRYFPATALGGKLYVGSLSERWDSKQLAWVDKSIIEIFISLMVHRKAETVEELEEILHTSESGLPAVRVWIHEGLEPMVRNLFETPR